VAGSAISTVDPTGSASREQIGLVAVVKAFELGGLLKYKENYLFSI
jgi:hypothetical protein